MKEKPLPQPAGCDQIPVVRLWPRTFAGKLWLLALVACVIRVAFVWQVRTTLQEPWGYALAPGTDMPKYVRYAHMVLQGNPLAEDVTISPLAPLVVLPVLLALAAGNLIGAMMWQSVLGSVQVGLIGLIGRRYLSEAGALVAAGLAALYAPFIVHDAVPLTEPTINVCFLLTWWAYLRLRESPGGGRAVVTGGAWGLAIAAKPTMAVLLPLLVLGDWMERGRILWRSVGLAAVLAALVIAPFIVRTRLLCGEWLFLRGNTSYMMLMGNYPGATGDYRDLPADLRRTFEAEVGTGPGKYRRRDAVAAQWVRRFWVEHPAAAGRLLWRKIGLLFAPNEIPNNISQEFYSRISFLKYPVFVGAGLLWPLAGLGLVVTWRRWRAWSTVLVPFVGYGALIVMTIVVARLRLPLMPAAMLVAAAGGVWLYNEGRRFDWARTCAVGLVGVGLILLNRATLARWLRPTVTPVGERLVTPEGWFYREEPWDLETAYSAWIDTPDGELIKRIWVRQEDLPRAAVVELKMRCVVEGAGRFVVELNGCAREVEYAVGLRGENSEVTLPFPAACLRVDNQIVFRVKPDTRLRLFLDDAWWYGRSSAQDAGEDFCHDAVNHRPARPRHVIRGEWQVGLLLIQSRR